MTTKSETHVSTVLQAAGRAFLTAVFVTSEVLIHADLAARSLWSYLGGEITLEPCLPVNGRAAITDPRRPARTPRIPKSATVSRARRSCSAARSAAC